MIVLAAFVAPSPSCGQPDGTDKTRPTAHLFDSEAGEIPKRYVGPEGYGAHKQNWDATQDTSGTFYVANTDGVLVYDGHTWRTVAPANESIVRSVDAGPNGRVFVGAQREFGVVQRDSTGQLRYTSLLDHVPEEHRSFTDIWRTEVTRDGVYFHAYRRLFRWNPETQSMQSWAPTQNEEFGQGGAAHNTFYVRHLEQGLMAVQDDSLRAVEGGEIFAGRRVIFVRPHPQHHLVVGTYEGLYVRDGDSFRRMQTDAPDLIRSAWMQRGRVLSDGTIVIPTIDVGLLFVRPDGDVARLSPRDAPVPGVYVDTEGGIWALMDGGLMRYDFAAPFTEYGDKTGLEGSVHDVAWHRGALFVATLQNLFRREGAQDSVSFTRERGINTQSWALLSVGEDLLVGTVRGLNRIGPSGDIRRLFDANHVYGLLRSRHDSTRVYAATGRGVRLVRRTEEGWISGPKVPGLDTEARTLAETDNGTLWVGTSFDGVYRVRWADSLDSTAVDHFGPDHGLPADRVDPQRWNGDLVFGTSTGLMRFVQEPSPHFEPLTSLEVPPHEPDGGIFRLQTLEKGQAWGFTGGGAGRWTRRDTTWQWTPGLLHRLRGRAVNVLHVEKSGRPLWMGTQEGLIRYTPTAPGPGSPPPVHIQEVRMMGTDSLLATHAARGPRPTLPHAQNSLKVNYGTPSLAQPSAIEYQYRVTNRQEEWSSWTSGTVRQLQNLDEGEVTFSVRARTAYGDTTRTARVAFFILPPWYRTWWAYGGYGLLALLLVAGTVRWRTRRLQRQKAELEQAVEARTEAIQKQKDQLAEQAERLKELDAAKDRFFANLSHEFRTPLTLIRGPVQEVREHLERGRLEAVPAEANDDAEQLAIAERNVARLQRLIDQILGLARLEAGTYELAARPTTLSDEVPRLVRQFEPLAERHGPTLTVEVEAVDADVAPVYADREALERIVSNLLSNAIKFTPEGGRVRVTVTEATDHVTLTVTDTGPGIPEAKQETIFDRFEQLDDTVTREEEGTGIGLAFAQDLVTLHGGTITVESTEGQGTTFTVRFPRGAEHLVEDQIAASRQPVDAAPTDPPDEGPPPFIDDSPSTHDVRSPSPPEQGWAPDTTRPTGEKWKQDSNGQSKIVLIVDDNDDVRRYVRSVLTPTFTVIEAANGEEGIEHAREALPDVILADVMMPSVDGHEMTRHLKDDPRTASIPVIMVTARAGTSDEVEGLRIGADDYVTKPFDANVLRQRVGGVLTLQQRLRRRLEAELRDELDDTAEEATPDEEQRSEIERRARATVRDHLTESGFGVADLADALAMSRSSLYRKLKADAGVTPSNLVRQVRIEEATALLRNGEPVTQVAYAVGYESLSAFTSAFKSECDVAPSAYEAQHGLAH